jgi:ABC-2 type transport system permease protein
MSSRRAVGLVAWREITQRVHSRVFVFSTFALLLAVLAAIVIPSLQANERETLKVGLVGRTPAALVPALAQASEATGAEFESSRYATVVSGEQALRDGQVGVLVVDGRQLIWKSKVDENLKAVTVATLRRLDVQTRAAALGLTPPQTNALLAPAPVPERQLDPPDPDREARYAAALLGLFTLMWALMLYGGAVTTGVVQEKTSRVVEVLLSRVSARDLLTGKVLGIGAVGLFQLLLAVPVAIAAAALVDRVQLPNAVPSTIGWVILWFILGYASYSVAFAATAARASRAEETQSEQTVIALIPTFCALFALFYATESPDAWPARIASFIPVSAPFVLPVRAAVSDVALWEVALAVAIMLVSTYAVIRIAARVYTGAVLRADARPFFKDVMRAARVTPDAR